MRTFPASLCVILSFASFASAQSPGAQFPGEGVSRELARERARLVSNLRYEYRVTLDKKRDMTGDAVIRFDLKEKPASLALDYRDGKVEALQVNRNPLKASIDAGHINLPGAPLKLGPNTVELHFTSGVAEANRAITRFVDSQDGNEYQYSLFVPMDAQQAFPLFDQPDLKGRFTLEVIAPTDWKVVANGAETTSDMPRKHRFEETRPISTYLFAFAAGPFEILPNALPGLPMRMFVRKSSVTRAKEEWPAVEKRVRQGIGLLSAYFAQPFPFPKYDQILLPGFPYGGMEHAGATFLNEDGVLFRTLPTASDYNRRSTLLLHELAHQWFGDLVTMRWFDDLWLKEGFAQYMAYRTLADLEPPSGVWKRFYESIKPNAYTIDGTRGTTPIYQQIKNLKDAKSAYGAIVYSKAPSLLRVLSFRIGEDAFRLGTQLFLKEHAYANAEWSDLIGAFSRSSKTDLLPWANAWVQQRGMPQVEIDWDCDPSNRIRRFQISQKDALGERGLWPIEMEVLLGHKNDPPTKLEATLNTASMSLASAIGKSCPDYVFSNNDDHGYGRFLLDPKSQTEVIAELPTIGDPFLRALLLGALWDGVKQSRLAPAAYLDLAMTLLPAEKDAEIANTLLARMRTAYAVYLPQEKQRATATAMEALLLKQMRDAATPDLRIAAFRSFNSIASTPAGLGVVKDLLTAKTAVPGMPLRQRDRWNLISTLIAQSDPDAEDFLAKEAAKDTTEEGKKSAYIAGAGRALAANKQRYFSDYLTKEKVREDWITASLAQFNEWNQSSFSAPFLKSALEALPQMKRERKIFFVNGWLASFVGAQRTRESLEIVDDFLASPTLDADLRLKILEARDELERTVRIRASN